jgi:transglutaminase-like putative cysteine protease
MSKIHIRFLALAMGLIAASTATAAGPSALSVGFAPSVRIPVGTNVSEFAIGGSTSAYLQFDLSQPGGVFLRSVLDYSYAPYAGGNSLSLMAFSANAGYTLSFSPRFRLDAFGGGGYNYGFKNSSAESGGSLYAEAGLGLDLLVSPALGFTLGASYRNYFGLMGSIGAYLGVTYFISGRETRQAQIRSALPVDIELLKGYKVAPPGKGLSIEKVDFAPVFPVFRKYYDDHPIGTITVKNLEKTAISNVTVSLYIKEFMDTPKTTPVGTITPGESVDVHVLGLFNEHVLENTEATKTPAEINVDYRMSDAPYRAERVESLRVLYRNAMTWEDNRRAAAFVTAKDPAVLEFAKNITGAIRDTELSGLNSKLATAFALHEALYVYGVNYVVDPTSAYASQSANKSAADFLQFPRETLSYKGGDCDDLSILNAALLESVGIETAFITVPGHIFVACALDTSPDDAARSFAATDDLIVRDGVVWVPIEITNISNGFMKAWQEGAKQWRDYAPKGLAGFYPIRDAWNVYESVALPGATGEITPPPKEKVFAAFLRDAADFVSAQLGPQVARFRIALDKNPDDRDTRNKLGVLYARFGKYDEARTEFQTILVQKEHLPALVNLGNIDFLSEKWIDARGYYERAAKLDPTNSRVLLGIARAAYELEDKASAKLYYDKANSSNPALCAKFSYLGDQGATDTARAADEAAVKEIVVWEEQP